MLSDGKESAADIGSVVDVFAICSMGFGPATEEKEEGGQVEGPFLQLVCGVGFVV